MNLKSPLAVSGGLIAAMAAASAWAWPRIGTAPVAVHWTFGGAADGYAAPAVALAAGPAIAAGVTLLLAALPAVMPRGAPLERSARAYAAVWIGVVALVAAMHAVVVGEALGLPFTPVRMAGLGAGVLFVLIGNFLPKMRRNFVMGVRTPWTLADERVWDRTHRFAGPLFMACGLLVALAAIALPEAIMKPVLLVGLLAPAGAAVAFSFVEARRLGAA